MPTKLTSIQLTRARSKLAKKQAKSNLILEKKARQYLGASTPQTIGFRLERLRAQRRGLEEDYKNCLMGIRKLLASQKADSEKYNQMANRRDEIVKKIEKLGASVEEIERIISE